LQVLFPFRRTKKFVETSKTKILINMSTTEEALLPSIQVKKARAEKFGTSVALTEEEKLAAREARFSKSQEDLEKIAKRRAKFGTSVENEKLDSELKTSEDDAKTKGKPAKKDTKTVEERLNASLDELTEKTSRRGGGSRGGRGRRGSGRGKRGSGSRRGAGAGKSSVTPSSLMVTKVNDHFNNNGSKRGPNNLNRSERSGKSQRK
jgi:uncharacterized membrane protein YgcG